MNIKSIKSKGLSVTAEDAEDNINRLREFLAKAAKDGTDVEPAWSLRYKANKK